MGLSMLMDSRPNHAGLRFRGHQIKGILECSMISRTGGGLGIQVAHVIREPKQLLYNIGVLLSHNAVYIMVLGPFLHE